ncbi:MAG: LysR family transcriptional regulator [Myxococcota bacterium]
MQKLGSDPRRVQVFVRAVELGSFSELARAWGVKPSSVSRQVGSLEDELGVRLLQRTTRKLHLTEAGTLLYERAKAALEDLEEAFRSASEFNPAPRGELRISAPVAFGRRYIAPLVKGFMVEYPEIALQVFFHDRFVDLVGEGYDAVVRAGHVRDEGLVARRLARNFRILCASPVYLETHGEPRVPQDLKAHEALRFRYVDATDEWRFRKCGTRTATEAVRVHGRLASNNGDLLLQAAVDGLGIALVPEWLAVDELRAGRVRRLLSEFEVTATDFDSELHLLFPSRRHLPAKMRALIGYLETAFRSPPWERPADDGSA